MVKAIKDKLFYYMVLRNQNIKKEYERYVLEHLEEHSQNRIKHWIILFKLNWHYRIRRKDTAMLISKKEATTLCVFDNIMKLTGSESSTAFHRRLYHQVAKELLQYDIISFDVFDTLIFRPFNKPRDIFMVLGEKFDCLDFYKIRNDMEMRAREKAFSRKGNREVTLEDIYAEIERYTGIPKEYGVQVEFETELALCYANPYMHAIFSILKQHGKRIIAVSDMWLTKAQLKELLDHCGYSGFDEILVSNDCNANKTTRTIYKMINNIKKPDESIIHIGDNLKTDVKNAISEGWKAIHYKGVNDIGNAFRASQYGMSPLIGSVYSGIINSRLHNGLYDYSPYYEYGYVYGGIYVYGLCSWINDYASKNKLDKILFLALDCEIYKKVFSVLYPDKKIEYVLWSRIVNSRLTAEKDRFNFIQRMIRARINSSKPITINDLITGLNLDFLTEQLNKYNLKPNSIVLETNCTQIESLFIDNWPHIIECFKEESDLAKLYYQFKIGDSKKIAVVDVGWQGTGVLGLKWLIESKWKLNCTVDCLMAATQAKSIYVNQTKVLDKTLHSYMFDFTYNKHLYNFHEKANHGLNSFLFEIFTQATSPTFS